MHHSRTRPIKKGNTMGWKLSKKAVSAMGPTVIGLVALSILLPTSSFSQAASNGPFHDWILNGDAHTVGSGDGVLHIDTGSAVSPAAPLVNGSFEFEVQPSGHRSFVYAQFRVGSDGTREEIYLRPHNSNQPDALQYTPVLARSSQWQLFWGENGTTAAAIPAEAWTKVRLEFQDRKLVVFVGDVATPTMIIPRLTHAPQAGSLALRSFIARGSEAPFGARFRRVKISAKTTFDFSTVHEPRPTPADARIVRDWQAATPFAAEAKTFSKLPTVDEADWQPLVTEPNGVALLHRLGRVEGANIEATVVRLEITAEGAQTKSLDLGFSDAASVFLNGQPIVSIDQSYSFQRPRVQGLLGLHQARLHLSLEHGRNELRVVVADSFGGWGIIGRWVEDAP